MANVKKDNEEEKPMETHYIFSNPETGERLEPIWLQQLRNLPAESKRRLKRRIKLFNTLFERGKRN